MASFNLNNIITKERAMGLEKEKNFVSCILYLHNDGETVYDFLSRICGVMKNHFDKYEIICVNDGCVDNTVSEIRRYRQESGDTHAVSLINLSYYQGMESAMSAGRDLAVGDFLFEFDQCTMDFEEDQNASGAFPYCIQKGCKQSKSDECLYPLPKGSVHELRPEDGYDRV